MAQILTHITRGNLIESTHKSKCVIKNYNYKTVFSTKNNKDLVYPRSAIKILQAIPFIQSQAKNKYDLSQKQIAICCSSHCGEEEHINVLKEWIKKRLKRMPLQYITGNTEFYGKKFFLNKDVFIPRPETERLVEISLECIKQTNNPKVLEVGTGSGCISISLALERKDAQILSIDISENALKKAKENAEYHKTKNVSLSKVDILNNLPEGKYDMLISNPPYISYDEMQTIMVDVKDFEPELALTDFKDGLQFYARLSDIGPLLIKKGGWMLLEVGLNDHSKKVVNLFKSKGFKDIDLLTDYNNNKRVLRVKI